MSYREYKCPRCGRVPDAVPLVDVEPGSWPESAEELLDALQTRPAVQINLFGGTCSLDDAVAVLNADDKLQAARNLMTKKLNLMGVLPGAVEPL